MIKQTAVEYIAESVIKYAFIDKKKAKIELSIPFELWNEIVKKAFDMEKDQICWAYHDGQHKDKKEIPSKYYHETYKK